MRRREFVTLLGGAALASPLVARAQQSMPVVGLLNGASAKDLAHQAAAFREGLNEAGFTEGRNLVIEYRWAENQYDKVSELASDLVARRVAVIAALGLPAAIPAKAATSTIPIVFYIGEDPLDFGLVKSFNKPGGNATGIASISVALLSKRMQILREIAPKSALMAVLINPKNGNAPFTIRDAGRVSESIGQKIQIVRASTIGELDDIFAKLAQVPATSVLVAADAFLNGRSRHIATLAERYRIPVSHFSPTFSAVGGLVSYGASVTDGWRQAGVYTGRILKGEKPGDLPVLQPTKFQLGINLKTAKAIGLAVPPSLLAIADEVIE